MDFYRNLPIQKKMIVGLIVFILVPLLAVGLIVSIYVAGLNADRRSTYEQNLLATISSSIELLLDETHRYAITCSNNHSLLAIVRRRASTVQYREANNLLTDYAEQRDYCEAVCLSSKGEVLFQRGNKYVYEREDRQMTGPVETGKVFTAWSGAHSLIRYDGVWTDTQTVLTYYVGIKDFIDMNTLGTVSIHLSENLLSAYYTDYVSDNSLVSMIVDGTGEILSCSDKSLLGTQCPFDREAYRDRTDFQAVRYGGEKSVLYVSMVGDNGWYLLNVVKEPNTVDGWILYIITAFVVCILFGCIYALIQRRYIIYPLQQLTRRMEDVKQGKLESLLSITSGDEIGEIAQNFEAMMERINRLIGEVFIQKIKMQEAEREVLLTQIKPHFLYNTLDSIHWLALRNRDYEVSRQLEALSEMFKHILNFGREMITVVEEVAFMENYCYLHRMRCGDRFDYFLDAPEELRCCTIPKLLVQPLVENSIIHGFDKLNSGGKVRVRFRQVDENMVITVLDNGEGVDRQEVMMRLRDPENTGKGFALRNVDERIKLHYGKEYGLWITGKRGFGCRIRLILPIEKEDNREADDSR